MPVVLISGCSSGFGECAAFEFARRGHRVHAGVRREADAEALAAKAAARGLDLKPVLLDVTEAAAIDRCVETIIGEAGGIDVLINNAGIAASGAFEDMPDADYELIMAVNFFGPVRLTRAVLPHMRRQAHGRIIMVSSLSALVGLPGEGFYAASKAALEAASQALRHEVGRFGIHVSVIEPGLFNTRMPEKIASVACHPPGSPYAALIDHLMQRMRSRVGEGDDPQRVAELLVEIAGSGDPPFRIPAGAQAEQIVARLRAMSDAERDASLPAIHDTRWWSRGDPRPSG